MKKTIAIAVATAATLAALAWPPVFRQPSVSLAWTPSSSTSTNYVVAGYIVYWATNSFSNYAAQASAPVGGWGSTNVGNATNTTIQLPSRGVPYFFVVTAYTPNGLESLPSDEVSYTPETPPTIPGRPRGIAFQ